MRNSGHEVLRPMAFMRYLLLTAKLAVLTCRLVHRLKHRPTLRSHSPYSQWYGTFKRRDLHRLLQRLARRC